MTDPLKSYIEQYTRLESGVQQLVLEKCAQRCAGCTAICCDKVMCVEAITSPFLQLMHQKTEAFDPENGFLSPSGCMLKKGRPSVCYEYFCDNHFYYQPSDRHAEVLQILGCLLYHAGQKAKGGRALDEVPEDQLETMDFGILKKQLEESMQALKVIQVFFETCTLSEEDAAFLKTIRIPDEFDTPAESSIHST